MKIKIAENVYTEVDDIMMEGLLKYNWCFEGRYAYRREGGKKIYLHRQLLQFPDSDVDHINQDKLDNRLSNLRCATRSQNMANASQRHKNATSKYRGVCFCKKKKKFKAETKYKGKRYYVGIFSDEKEAAVAYNKKVLELHGEYAILNNVNG